MGAVVKMADFEALEKKYQGLQVVAKDKGYSLEDMGMGGISFPSPASFKEYNSIDIEEVKGAGILLCTKPSNIPTAKTSDTNWPLIPRIPNGQAWIRSGIGLP